MEYFSERRQVSPFLRSLQSIFSSSRNGHNVAIRPGPLIYLKGPYDQVLEKATGVLRSSYGRLSVRQCQVISQSRLANAVAALLDPFLAFILS